MIGNMTSAHFIFIPAVLLVGIIIGWVLGSRAAADAYAMELKRREERKSPGLEAINSESRFGHSVSISQCSRGLAFA